MPRTMEAVRRRESAPTDLNESHDDTSHGDTSHGDSPRSRRLWARSPLWTAPIALALIAIIATSCWAITRSTVSSSSRHVSRVEARWQRQLVAQLNRERHAHHLPPLTANKKLTKSARGHATLMSKRNKLSHRLAKEAVFTRRISRAGYTWSFAGENVAWTSRTTAAGVAQLETIMYSERPPNDPHRRNILGRQYRNVGIGVVYDATHHRAWITEDFGTRLDVTHAAARVHSGTPNIITTPSLGGGKVVVKVPPAQPSAGTRAPAQPTLPLTPPAVGKLAPTLPAQVDRIPSVTDIVRPPTSPQIHSPLLP